MAGRHRPIEEMGYPTVHTGEPAELPSPAAPSSAEPDADEFAAFVARVEADLRGAFLGWCGVDGAHDAAAEALAWAWEHWPEVLEKTNPVAFLYRVGQSRSRARKQGRLPSPATMQLPDVEPALIPALQALPQQQRAAVWLVHGCGWTYAECAEALGISASAVGTHVSRGLAALRAALDADPEGASDAGRR
jgi:DNA-directed RNA polymerase specialized sigma24 family protein